VTTERFTARRNMLEAVNEHFRGKEKADNLDAMDTFYQRAYGLISSEKARDAFDINKEDAKLRDAYGRNAAGQRMLMARRLVEAGVRFDADIRRVDMHSSIKEHPGASSPVRPGVRHAHHGLAQRGLRTAHWSWCRASSGGREIAWRRPRPLAEGDGVRWPAADQEEGRVWHADATATEPEDDPLDVDALSQTVYHCLGISREELMSPTTGRSGSWTAEAGEGTAA
jgi:hypothetical protein